MEAILEIPAAATIPPEGAVLTALGYTTVRGPDARTLTLLAQSFEMLEELCAPKGLYATIERAAFAAVHAGEGRNQSPAPLEEIYPRARHLALFAVTLGSAIEERIRALFDAREFALGAILDAAASEAAEQASVVIEERFVDDLQSTAAAAPDTTALGAAAAAAVPDTTALGAAVPGGPLRALCYSPGYCGWDLSGQRALFAALDPGRIGISLNEHSLMLPAKSISGVIVAGPAAIHRFENDYRFCAQCRPKSCRARLRTLSEEEEWGALS